MPDPNPLGALLTSTPPDLSDAEALALVQAHFGVTGRLTRLTSERDLNFRLATADADYVLKLANPAEPAALTAFQTEALLYIAAHAPDLPVPRVMPTVAGDTSVALRQGRLRLLTYLQGTPMHMVPRTAALRADTARMAARLARALQGFAHPAADHVLLWDIKQSALLADLLPSIADPALRALCADWVDRFTQTIAPALADVPWQVVHADLNPHNVLVDPADHNRVAGVLDFGDMVRTPRACDLAVAASYQVDFAAPLPSVCAFAAAYHAELPLTRAEAGLVFDLVAMRMVTTLAITSWRAERYPENAPYILRNFALAKAGLEGFSTIDRSTAARAVLHTCGMES